VRYCYAGLSLVPVFDIMPKGATFGLRSGDRRRRKMERILHIIQYYFQRVQLFYYSLALK